MNCCAMSARRKNFDAGNPENGRSAGNHGFASLNARLNPIGVTER